MSSQMLSAVGAPSIDTTVGPEPGEITLLVEDAVVRKLLFVVGRGYAASPDQGAGVVQAARVRMRMAQDDRDPRNRTPDPLHGFCYGPG
jgi:hypothetical protein